MLSRVFHLKVVLIGVWCLLAEGRPLLEVNNTQDVFQAEEHSNIPLTMSTVNATSVSLQIDLMRLDPLRNIFWYDSINDLEPLTNEQFRGRLQCDLQLVRNGWIKCLLSDLRLSDSGKYQWIVTTDGRSNLQKYQLKVSAVRQQTQEETLKSTQRGRYGMYVAFGLCAVVIVSLALHCRTNTFSKFYPDHPSYQK
ncbi:hypothetical protein AMECASPLE_027138 [Ameca splendens]|uniref:Immunoglobulin V-set domain-containing protein n=1 Tax=Ameca splendens TaxID=208324 RepID=A0ABV0ZGI1_9TELE